MAYFGVDMDVRIQEVNLQFKNIIRSKGGIGLRTLGTIFKRMDQNGNGRLDVGEFEEALSIYGYAYFLTVADCSRKRLNSRH